MAAHRRLPPWFKVPSPGGENYRRVKGLVKEHRLHTICEEARCPNAGECWEQGTATFLALGDVCTRACAYCAVTSGRPGAVDWAEPFRIGNAVKLLGLSHAVVTSVNRDDLADGGAEIFARTVHQIRRASPECRVEVLVPDFMGDWDALRLVMESAPDVLNHNIETVERLFPRVRPKGRYDRSIELLARAREMKPRTTVKSGIIVGMGERVDEVHETMSDLREAGVEVITLGQYLRPSDKHLPVERYYHPDEFESLRSIGLRMGFGHVESGPLVRSSYHAHEQALRA